MNEKEKQIPVLSEKPEKKTLRIREQSTDLQFKKKNKK